MANKKIRCIHFQQGEPVGGTQIDKHEFEDFLQKHGMHNLTKEINQQFKNSAHAYLGGHASFFMFIEEEQ